MLLLRMTKHVRDQNWLAVGLDFVIVVAGVFIGVQLGNWNGANADKAAYEAALERYRAEIEVNLATLDTFDEDAIANLKIVSGSFDALLSCEDSEETLNRVNLGLNGIVGTYGLSLRSAALEELVSSARLLEQQDLAARARFSDTAFKKAVFLREAAFIELLPLEERMENNPILKVGTLSTAEVSYVGADYSRPNRPLALTVPVSEACKDNRLIKSFYTWERWQSALPAVSRILRQELESDRDWLDERL